MSHPEGWRASQIVLLAVLIKGRFQEITRHDVSSWMGRCDAPRVKEAAFDLK